MAMATKEILNSALDIVRRSSKIGKIMVEKSILERERKLSFQRLGELTYSLIKTHCIQDDRLEELVNAIDDINKRLRHSSELLDSEIIIEEDISSKDKQ